MSLLSTQSGITIGTHVVNKVAQNERNLSTPAAVPVLTEKKIRQSTDQKPEFKLCFFKQPFMSYYRR